MNKQIPDDVTVIVCMRRAAVVPRVMSSLEKCASCNEDVWVADSSQHAKKQGPTQIWCSECFKDRDRRNDEEFYLMPQQLEQLRAELGEDEYNHIFGRINPAADVVAVSPKELRIEVAPGLRESLPPEHQAHFDKMIAEMRVAFELGGLDMVNQQMKAKQLIGFTGRPPDCGVCHGVLRDLGQGDYECEMTTACAAYSYLDMNSEQGKAFAKRLKQTP